VERKTLGLIEVAAGALLYRSMCVKSSFKTVVSPDVDFAVKAGGNAVSVLMATRSFEQLGCSENASWGLVVGSVLAYEWLKFRGSSAAARGYFAGEGAVLPPPKRPVPVTYTPAYMPGTVPQQPLPPTTYVPHDYDFGPGF
jgi:hypothetical protein